MKTKFGRKLDNVARQQALLVALSDDLALPLIQIKSAQELIASADFSKPVSRSQSVGITASAEAGLKMIEAYRLLLTSQEILNMSFDPVAVGAILDDVAHQLVPFASQYATKIEVDVQGRLTPVLVHQPSLSVALQTLSASLIRAQVAQQPVSQHRLVLGAHRYNESLVAAGVFSEVKGLSGTSLRAAHSLVGKARQPLPVVPPGTAGGILIADMLCTSLWQPLRHSAHRSLGGLVTTLPTSKQMQFV